MVPRIFIKLLGLRKELLLSIIVLISLLGIVGWVFNITLLTGGSSGFIPIAPLTALSFILIAFSVCWVLKHGNNGIPLISKILLLATLFLALIIFIQHILHLSTDIENIFGKIAQPFGNVRKGRMSPVTSVLFILSTLSILFQYSLGHTVRRVGESTAILILGYTFLLIMGYAYKTPFLYSGDIIPVAFPTSLSFLLLSFVIIDLYKINLLPIRYRRYSRITIQLAKAFLPVSLLIIIIHGFAEANILYVSKNPAVGSFVLLLLILSLFVIVILVISKSLGMEIERVENEKMQILQEKQHELKRQNEEYYALYEEYKTTSEDLNQKNEDLLLANKQLFDSEEKYHSLFENMLNGFAFCKMIYDKEEPVDFVYLEVNKAFGSLTGLKNVVGKTVTEVIPGIRDSNSDIFNIYGRVALNGISEKFEIYIEELKMWFSVSVFSPETCYFVAVFEVITERKQAENALKESQKQLLDIIDNTPALVYASDKDGKIILANKSLANIFNTNREVIIGKTRLEFLPPEIAEQHRQNEIEVMDKKQSIVFEETNMEHDGKHTYYTIKFPLFDSSGQVYSVCGISMDITSRKAIEEQLRIAKEKAEESDRLKTAFLQNMSHEIRTPMNAIMGFSQLLPENFNNKPKLELFSNIINQRSIDLLEIINEILDISKIESGQVTVHFEECDLTDLFNELYTFFIAHKEKIKKQELEFVIETCFDTTQSVIITDKVKLKQVFINLINNAFRFTSLGKIKAGCFFDKNKNFIFYVTDTGIGIPAEKQSEIFQRFTQLNSGIENNLGGTGLGLAIVKGLIGLLGGEIWMESQVGIGSKFYFTFPYKIETNQRKVKNERNGIIKYQFKNKVVLIVEDDIYNSAYLKEILAGTGLTILHSEFGKDAVKISLNQPVDIVLMDIRLPDMDGYEATRLIKEIKQNLKIIAQTAYATQADKQKAFDSGCDDFISKPVNKDKLLKLIYDQLMTAKS